MSSIFVKDSLGSLYGAEAAACSIFISNFEDEITTTFIICPNDFYGRRFYQTLSLFFNSKETLLSSIPKIFYFPSWDTLPFEQRSPDSSITGERVSTLFKILNSSSSSILISPVNAVFQKVISKERFYKQILKSKFNYSRGLWEQSLRLSANPRTLSTSRVKRIPVPGSLKSPTTLLIKLMASFR